MTDKKKRLQTLESAEERLDVRFPEKFKEAFLGGTNPPGDSPAENWNKIDKLQWPVDTPPPAGIGFPEEGDPDFYCLLEQADGTLSEIVHFWDSEAAAYTTITPYLGAKEGSWDADALGAQSPLVAVPEEEDDEDPRDWESALVSILLERELLEIRPINRPYVVRLVASRGRKMDPTNMRRTADKIVSAMEDAEIIEDFYFDSTELLTIMQELMGGPPADSA